MPHALASISSVFGTVSAPSALAIMVSGAVAGFTSTLIATGSLDLAFCAGITGFMGAGMANMIGHSAFMESIYKTYKNSQALIRALAHGLSRTAITVMQGGKALGGFLSGFAGSLLGGFVKGLNNTILIPRQY